MTNFGPLLRGQPHSPDVKHCVSNVFDLKVNKSLVMRFLYLQSHRQSSSYCDTSENSAYWLNKCSACCNAKKFVSMLEIAAITNYKQWEMFMLKSKKKTARVKVSHLLHAVSPCSAIFLE